MHPLAIKARGCTAPRGKKRTRQKQEEEKNERGKKKKRGIRERLEEKTKGGRA